MDYPVRVTCPECPYSQVVREGDDRGTADYVVEHGLETGHILSIEWIADSADADRKATVQ